MSRTFRLSGLCLFSVFLFACSAPAKKPSSAVTAPKPSIPETVVSTPAPVIPKPKPIPEAVTAPLSEPETVTSQPLAAAPVFAKPTPSVIATPVIEPNKGIGGDYYSEMIKGDFAGYSNVRHFIDRMSEKHGFDRTYLRGLFSKLKRKDNVLRLMNKQKPKSNKKPKPGGWSRYKGKKNLSAYVPKGAAFWEDHADTLARAEAEYGVPAEYIMGIIGIETMWGRTLGKTRIVDALATLAFDYPRRARFFSEELEEFLLMAREENFDPREPKGSYAGAMGYGQFMPSSFRKYAVDFDGDGKRDLWNPVDAIGSVANYFVGHGWQTGQPIVVRAKAKGKKYRSLDWGFKHAYSLAELKRYGISPRGDVSESEVRFLKLSTHKGDQLWLGLNNFYVITRYNHSSYYAMAVHELGQMVKKRYHGG